MPFTSSDRDDIFNKISSILKKYSPPMLVAKNKPGVVYELMGNKPVPYGSTKKIVPGMYFCSVVARNSMISFYFFPIYYHTDDFIGLIPTMSKTLKGKTCFNIKKLDQVNEKELNALIKKGVAAWKKLGYLK